MRSVRVGIVGAGSIAEHHLKVLGSFPDVEVCAISNRDEEKGGHIAKKFGIPHIYAKPQTLFSQELPDAVYVLVSADALYPTTLQCIAFGIPLFIEKPAGLTSVETRHLQETALSNDVRIMVGYNRRFYSVIQRAQEAIRTRGDLLGVRIEAPEGIEQIKTLKKFSPDILARWFVANGTHGIDLLNFLGGDTTEVLARKRSFLEPSGDNFGATIVFLNSALGHYISHWNSPGRWSVDLYGVNIRAHIEPLESGTLIMDGEEIPLLPDLDDLEYKPGFWKQNRYFIDRVQDGGEITRPACSIADALKTMELAERILSGGSIN